MGRWLGYVFFAVCLYLAFEGYQNAKITAEGEAMARQVACSGIEDCRLARQAPKVVQTNALGREYTWDSNKGVLAVTCKREFLFVGDWRCSSRLAG